MSETIGVIGLGVMGSAMARNLVGAGHDVLGYDIDPSRLTTLADFGGEPAHSAGEVSAIAEIVVFSLPTTDALAVVAGEVAEAGSEGLICLETGTFPLAAKEAARDLLAASGIELLDTPLSGTGLQAADATLVVFASGSEQGFERARPVFDAIGRSTHYLGEFGNGSKMKYVANLLVAVHGLAAAEAHALGIAAGLDPGRVQEVMEDGVGSSKIFEIRGPMMVADDYPAAARLDILLKDSRIIREFARSVGAPTPLLDATVPNYEAASAAGLGDLDAAALCRYLEELGGLER
ncbi:MAG TPA: NAD(P)-dependent oxidoreductase [Acidimicrobiia bacterium]|jgi:putative dehydrogenase|nr:NAD(P)-dependent oxidoreductase [Acidimicrobiia bacterium]